MKGRKNFGVESYVKTGAELAEKPFCVAISARKGGRGEGSRKRFPDLVLAL
jgi:hypothetical protein